MTQLFVSVVWPLVSIYNVHAHRVSAARPRNAAWLDVVHILLWVANSADGCGHCLQTIHRSVQFPGDGESLIEQVTHLVKFLFESLVHLSFSSILNYCHRTLSRVHLAAAGSKNDFRVAVQPEGGPSRTPFSESALRCFVHHASVLSLSQKQDEPS